MNQVAVKEIESNVNPSSEKNAFNPIRCRLQFWFLHDSCPKRGNLDLHSINLGVSNLVFKLVVLIGELKAITTLLVWQCIYIFWYGNCWRDQATSID